MEQTVSSRDKSAVERDICPTGDAVELAEKAIRLCGEMMRDNARLIKANGELLATAHRACELASKAADSTAPSPEPQSEEDDSPDLYNSITANLKSAECALAIISGYVLDVDAYPYLRDMFRLGEPQPDAEPVGYLVEYRNDQAIICREHCYNEVQAELLAKGSGGTYFPVFRHPSPVSGAVAAKGVVEEITRCLDAYSEAFHNYAYNPKSADDVEKARSYLDAALAKIVELPEPSEWAKDLIKYRSGLTHPLGDCQPDVKLDLAAALIEAAKEGK